MISVTGRYSCPYRPSSVGVHRRPVAKELRVSDSRVVPAWVAEIVAEFARREGIEAEQVVRLLIIQGALVYEKAYRDEGFVDC
jgi:hypothetical protein